MSRRVVEQVDDAVVAEGGDGLRTAGRVLANPRFLALFISQVLTQVGGNMVLFALTIKVFDLTGATTSVSVLLLTFLVPAVIFGAVAGVFVDRYDRRVILVGTNLARGLLFLPLVFLDDQLAIIYVATALVATLTTFFAPAESAMIPLVVPRSQLLSANGLFIFGLQASFALGFAVLGPLLNSALGTEPLILIVAVCYIAAGLVLLVLPKAPPSAEERIEGPAVGQAEQAVGATFSQLREGLTYIRTHRNIFWSLTYLAITASLIGVLGTLGPAFAEHVLGLDSKDFVVIVLPLGAGLVLGIVVLGRIGGLFSRRRLIEGGLAVLAASLAVLALAQQVDALVSGDGPLSLLGVVVSVAFIAGVTYAFVAVPAQTALQEELPPDVRGRVFGVLNTLVSLASFLPIIVVGPIADLVGTPAVILASAVVIALTGVGSYVWGTPVAGTGVAGRHEATDPVTVTATSSTLMRPPKLAYLDEDPHAPIRPASPVTPGVRGPRPDAPAPDDPSRDAAP